MTASITLTVTLSEQEPEEGVDMTAATAALSVEGMDPEDAPTVVLAAIEKIVTGRHLARLEQTSPFGNSDTLSALAMMNARLELHARLSSIPFGSADTMDATE